MRFRFVHAADLHLDSPMRGLGRLEPHLAPLFADATRKAFEALVDRTLELGAAFLVIAGDIYDGDWKDYGTGLFFARQLARLSRAGIPTILIRGNHDAESLITRSLTLPEGVHVLGARAAETVELAEFGVALHGRSFAERETSENVVLAYPPARPGRFNIGLLHTSLDGRSSDHAPYAPCSVADLRAKGYDYWALGHVHGDAIIERDPPIVFSGNLQGRHVRETGAKGAMLIEVEDGRVVATERLIVDVARWAALSVDVSGAATHDEVVRQAEMALKTAAIEAGDRPLGVRLILTGTTAAHRSLAVDRAALRSQMQAAADRIGDSIAIEKVLVETRAPDEPRSGDEADALVDPAALLGDIDADAMPGIEAVIANMLQRLPEPVQADLADLAGPSGRARLLAEARDLAIGRLAGTDAGR